MTAGKCFRAWDHLSKDEMPGLYFPQSESCKG